MKRRDFIRLAGLTAVGTGLPGLQLLAAPGQAEKIVVLVHLKGGNDGFNTLIPYEDEQYYKARPRIAIPQRQLLKLNHDFGLHPQLKPLLPLWKEGELAMVQGVGYPDTVLSHFKSLDVWESGSPSQHRDGWLSDVLPHYKQGLHGVVIGAGVGGNHVMQGPDMNAVTMQNPAAFIRAARKIKDIEVSKRNAALAHVSHVQHQLHTIGQQISQRVGAHPKRAPGHFSGELGHSLEAVAQMIINGVDSPVYKVAQNGFDTHAGQVTAQSNALYQLAGGLTAFAKVMKQTGHWNKVLLVTYSEFGRRLHENRGAGTDHGTASVQMVLGGAVKGGIYGRAPDLAQLDENGNVINTTDFRTIYATLAQRWWRRPNPWRGHAPIPFV